MFHFMFFTLSKKNLLMDTTEVHKVNKNWLCDVNQLYFCAFLCHENLQSKEKRPCIQSKIVVFTGNFYCYFTIFKKQMCIKTSVLEQQKIAKIDSKLRNSDSKIMLDWFAWGQNRCSIWWLLLELRFQCFMT